MMDDTPLFQDVDEREERDASEHRSDADGRAVVLPVGNVAPGTGPITGVVPTETATKGASDDTDNTPSVWDHV